MILAFGIEGYDPFGLGGTEKALVGGNEREVVAATAEVLGDIHGNLKKDGIGGVDGVFDNEGECVGGH